MHKKFICMLLGSTLGLLILIGGINIVVDPYFQYHMPLFGMEADVYDERYQNPGIAKHFTYDSILIGSSMSQNFKISELNKVFDVNAVKLTFSAIRTSNMNYMFDLAFNTHEIDNVFLGLDMDPLFNEPGHYQIPIPEYLYDGNVFNDVNYFLNKSVLFDASFDQVNKNRKNIVEDIDKAYTWWEEASFSKENALSFVDWDFGVIGNKQEHPEYLENAVINLNTNILPHIQNHPETKFYIFYPPFSLLWWNNRVNKGDLDALLDLIMYASEELLAYDNVQLYGFQNIESLVSDLDRYKDLNHYDPQTNSEMLVWMKNDKYRLTKENLNSYISDLENLVTTFDYNSFLE